MGSARDTGVAAALFAGTIAYLWFWPRELNGFDESLYLYEAKRVYDGAVMYRDFFNIITPAWFYLIAGLYALFGVSIETARGAMAVTHALIGLFLFVICRQVGVRLLVAVLLAMTHLVLGYPMSAIATPHWCSTLLTLVLLFVLVRWPQTTVTRAVLCGALGAVLTLVQQQKGTLMVAAAGIILLVTALMERPRPTVATAAQRAIGYAVGVVGVTAPALLALIAAAGFDEVFGALVRYPLVNYRGMMANNISWGGYWPGIFPHPYIIKYLPAVIPAAALWLAWRWWSTHDGSRLRIVAVLLIYAGFAFWSILYSPELVHFAYVAPVWVVLAGYLVEQTLRMVPGTRMVSVVTLLLIAAGCWQLYDSLVQVRTRCKFRIQTAFGQIDTQNPEAGAVYQWFNDLFRNAGATHVFAFPTNAALYLITGTENATRYQILLPRYNDREQIAEVVADLERRQTEFVVRNFYFRPREMEPLNSYLEEQYTALPLPPPFKTTNITKVYRRKVDAGRLHPSVF